MTPFEFFVASANWGSYMSAGDPGACMYGFDETGLPQSEEHCRACISWLSCECRVAALANEDPETDLAEIEEMIAYLEAAPLKGPSGGRVWPWRS